MSKLKIRRALADKLHALVLQNVKAGKRLIDAENDAYQAAAGAVSAGMRKKYPPHDMHVLSKYKVARPDWCVHLARLVNETSEVWEFKFRKDDPRAPLIPVLETCRWSPPVYDIGTGAGDLVAAWKGAHDAMDKDERERQAAYRILIESGTAKEIMALWPESVPVIEAFNNSGLPAPLSKSTVELLRRDMAERGVEA